MPGISTAQGFADAANSGSLPWNTYNVWNENKPWTDSAKEQYFSMLNAEQANQHEIEMWRLNNEYNTPEKQMERLVAAGLNPAAAYQQVTSGNASSAPSTHVSNTPAWHDTQDKIAKVNAIIGGIRDIMSTVSSGIGAAQDVQSMALRHQNNWYDQMRASYFGKNANLSPEYWISTKKDYFPKSFEIAPGLYMEAGIAQLFPEFLQGFKQAYSAPNFNLATAARQDQHSLVERRNRIDQLMQSIFDGFENNVSADQMLKWFLQLIAYGLQQRVGGGF